MFCLMSDQAPNQGQGGTVSAFNTVCNQNIRSQEAWARGELPSELIQLLSLSCIVLLILLSQLEMRGHQRISVSLVTAHVLERKRRPLNLQASDVSSFAFSAPITAQRVRIDPATDDRLQHRHPA